MNTVGIDIDIDNSHFFRSIYSNFGYVSHSNVDFMSTFRKFVETCKENTTDCTMVYYLFSFVAHVRDIATGKGQRSISYAMLYILYDSFPSFTVFLFRRFLDTYGSLRDIKGICRFFSSELSIHDHPLLNVAIFSFISILRKSSSSDAKRLLKWVPKEQWIHSRFPYLKSYIQKAKLAPLTNLHLENVEGQYNSLQFGYYVEFLVKQGSISNKKMKWIQRQWNSMIHSHFSSFKQASFYPIPILPVFEISNEMTDFMVFNAIGLVCALVQLYGSTRILCLSHVPFWISTESLDFTSLVFHLWSICSSRTFCHWKAGDKLLRDAFQHVDTESLDTESSIHIVLICNQSPPLFFVPTWLLWSLTGTSMVPSYSQFCISGIQSGLLTSLPLLHESNSQSQFVEKQLLGERYWPLHFHLYDSIGTLGSLYL